MMLNIDDAVDYLIRAVDAELLGIESDPDNAEERIILKLSKGPNHTNVFIDRRRLREINKSDASNIIEKIKESLERTPPAEFLTFK